MPRLNRLFTITAATEEFTETLIPWRYGDYGARGAPGALQRVGLPSTGAYVWNHTIPIEFFQINSASRLVGYRDTLGLSGQDPHSIDLADFPQFDSVQDIQDYLDGLGPTDLQLGANSIKRDGTANESLPAPSEVLRDAGLIGREVRVYPASTYPEQPYISFIADSRDEYPASDSRFGQYFFIGIQRGSLSLQGSDFTLSESDHIVVTVQGHTAASSLAGTETTHTGVWGELREHQAIQSIQPTGGGLVTSAEQSATLMIRFNPALAAGRTVTDDSMRDWYVESVRTLQDKRFIEYSLTRTISVI